MNKYERPYKICTLLCAVFMILGLVSFPVIIERDGNVIFALIPLVIGIVFGIAECDLYSKIMKSNILKKDRMK